MADPRFFQVQGPFTVAEIASLTGAEPGRPGDADRVLRDVAPLDTAAQGDLSFLDNRKYTDAFARSTAEAAFVRPALADRAPPGMALLLVEDPYRAYARAAQAFYPEPTGTGHISPHAIYDHTVEIGHGTTLGAGAVIGRRARLGERCRIAPNVTIGDGVVIGDDSVVGANASVSHALIGARVHIYPGARIGQDGFGFAMGLGGHVKVPQLGRVVIEDDVEIGANVTIDRGAGPDTVIGRGSVIDNLVQIGHNVRIGPHCVIVAQSGVSGSTVLGSHAVLAAQSGLTGHLSIGDGAQVGAQSGVMRDVPAGGRVAGSPAVPARQHWREVATLAKLAKGKGDQDG